MRRMVLALLLSSYLPSADASMVIDGTRIIFPATKRDRRPGHQYGETPLTQVWVDDGRVQNQPEKDAAPFIVLPPIVRIEPGKGQSWRRCLTAAACRRIGNRCSGSIFWISHLSRKMARLTITCSSRYGRVSSCFTVRQAWRRKNSRGKALSWALAPTGNGLRVSNASARYITIDSITLNGKNTLPAWSPRFPRWRSRLKGSRCARCQPNSASPPSMITAR